MLVHNFFIVNKVELYDNAQDIVLNRLKTKEYINISDDFMLKYTNLLKNISTYSHKLSHPSKGLIYHGITIFDEIGAKQLKIIIEPFIKKEKYINLLVDMCIVAMDGEHYLIHIGI